MAARDWLDAELDLASADGGPVLVDLCECPFVDSTALNAVLRARLTLRDRGGRIAVACAPDGPARRLFTVAVGDLFDLHDSQEAAKAALSRPPL